MSEQLDLSDFGNLALALKPILDSHGVPEQDHFSIISDAVFEFANLVDEKTGTSFHESIYPLLENYADKFAVAPFSDYLVAEVEIIFGKGRKAEFNLLQSQLEYRDELLLLLEVEFGVRDLHELDTEIDTTSRFAKIIKKKQGIKLLKFNVVINSEEENRQSVSLEDSDLFHNGNSLEDLVSHIVDIAKRWA